MQLDLWLGQQVILQLGSEALQKVQVALPIGKYVRVLAPVIDAHFVHTETPHGVSRQVLLELSLIFLHACHSTRDAIDGLSLRLASFEVRKEFSAEKTDVAFWYRSTS